MKKSKSINVTRIAKAKKNLERLQKEIAPFVKPSQYKPLSTLGRWQDTSHDDTYSFVRM